MAQSSFGPSHAFSNTEIKYPSTFEQLDYVNTQAPKTGTIRLASQGSFNNLNPFIISGVQASGLNWSYETLGVNTFDEDNTIYGLIAETFAYDKENKTFTVKLREEVKFNDQTKVTAADVSYTFNTLVQKGHPVYKQIFTNIEAVETPSSDTVIFKIKTSNQSQDLIFNIAKLPVLSKADLEKRDFEKTTLKPLLTTGPYQISDFQIGQKINYTRNENYWGKHLPINRGRNNFKNILYKYFKDQNIALTAFKAHRYDWRSENIAKFWKTQYQGDEFEQGLIKIETIKNKNPNVMQAFAMNLRTPPFNDITVRKALNLAFNFEWLNQNLFYDTYIRSQSFFPSSPFTASEPISLVESQILEPYKHSLPQELWQDPFKFEKKLSHEKLVEAQTLLDASDWKLQGKKRVNQKTGQPLRFTLLLNSPSMKRIALPYQKELKKIGINMEIQLISPSDWIARIKKFDFDMTTFTWSVSSNPGSQPYLYWHSSQASILGSNNIIGLDNPVIDDITTQIKNTENFQKRTAQMQALDRVLMWNYTVIPHWYIDYDRVAYWTCISPPKKHPGYGIDLASWYTKSSCD
ncbi:MAG: extracellular solute-binding protein [Pseudomonadota bacterium]|nr:extracellular solute-binding protein [Pseudomonadota bacterium]